MGVDVRSFKVGLAGLLLFGGGGVSAGQLFRSTFNSQLRTGTDRGNPTV